VDAVAAATGESKASTGEAIHALVGRDYYGSHEGRHCPANRLWVIFDGRPHRAGGPESGDGRRNPDPAAKTVKFAAGKAFKDAVNQ
jgi:DNA-binding protein HU-beta